MEMRIELRKKEFKKTFDSPRRKREEQQVQIRKQNREARLAKKRQQALSGIEPATSPAIPNNGTFGGSDSDAQKIPHMVVTLMSNDPKEQYLASQQFRRILSIEKNPPIQEVIDAGVVPRFVEFLLDDNRQDLQFEAAWALTNIASGTQIQTKVVIDNNAIPIFVNLLSSTKDDVREQAVWALGNIAGDCPSFRDIVIEQGGLIPLLGQLRSAQGQNRVTMLRNATWTLSNFCRGKPRPPLEWILPAIPVLRDLITLPDVEVLTDACWALSYISDGNDEKSTEAIDAVIKSGVAPRLVQLLGHVSYSVQTPALRTVGNIVSGNEAQTQIMVANGCVSALRVLLDSPRKLLRKEACWTVSNITAGSREQIQEVIANGHIPILIEITHMPDAEVKREADWALANAVSGAGPLQVKQLVNERVIPAICDILDMQDHKLVGVALEALENILLVGQQMEQSEFSNDNPYVRMIEEAGAFPKLEKLQFVDDETKVYQMAMRIMTQFLTIENDVDDDANYDSNNSMMPNDGFDFSA